MGRFQSTRLACRAWLEVGENLLGGGEVRAAGGHRRLDPFPHRSAFFALQVGHKTRLHISFEPGTPNRTIGVAISVMHKQAAKVAVLRRSCGNPAKAFVPSTPAYRRLQEV